MFVSAWECVCRFVWSCLSLWVDPFVSAYGNSSRARILQRTCYVSPCVSLASKSCHTFFRMTKTGQGSFYSVLAGKYIPTLALWWKWNNQQCLLSIKSAAVACAVQCSSFVSLKVVERIFAHCHRILRVWFLWAYLFYTTFFFMSIAILFVLANSKCGWSSYYIIDAAGTWFCAEGLPFTLGAHVQRDLQYFICLSSVCPSFRLLPRFLPPRATNR